MKKILTLLAIALATVTSCKEEEITQESYIYLNYEELVFDAEGGEDGFYVECTDVWKISGSADWCEVSSMSGINGDYVSFKVEPSEDTDERRVTYTFVCGTASQEFTVIQKQKDALTVTSSNFEVPANGQGITIEVKANIQFEYEVTDGSEWIHEVETKAMETTVLNFVVDANSEFEDREGQITITSGDISETITIHQAEAVPAINIETKEYEVSAECEPITVEIDANVEYSYSTDADWIHFADNSEKGIVLEIDRNNLLESRAAEIEFYNEEYNISVIISVTQNAYGLEDMLKTVHVETKGTLSKVLAENGADAAEYLKITGVLNDVDFLTLNEMGINNLIYLDISEVDMTVLPNDAMNGSTNLSYIVLPKNLTEIGAGAFYGTSIKDVNIPETVEKIGKSAFCYCDALSEVNIPTGLKEMGSYVFYHCTSLTGDIIIPSTIESLGDYIFEGTSIQSVTFKAGEFPISVTRQMFYNCKNLSSVNFEAGCQIEELSISSFEDCSALSEITIPAEVTSIRPDAFKNCISLRSVAFETGSKLAEINGYLNSGQYSDYSISGAFMGCSALTSITIPASVETIDGGAFYGCTSLKEVKFEEGSNLKILKAYASYNVFDYNNHAGKRWHTAGAFENCSSLKSFTVPSGVTEIDGPIFKNCSSLTEVSFEQGSKLQRISGTYYQHETTLNGPNPFDGCPLATFDASNCTELTTLEDAPFDGCSISLFKLGAIKPPESEFFNWYIGRDIGTTSYAILKVPDESVNAYKSSYWSNYFSTISGLSE